MDYLGRRMMTSSHPTLRRFWWVPQVAGAGFSFGSGMHNYNWCRSNFPSTGLPAAQPRRPDVLLPNFFSLPTAAFCVIVVSPRPLRNPPFTFLGTILLAGGL